MQSPPRRARTNYPPRARAAVVPPLVPRDARRFERGQLREQRVVIWPRPGCAKATVEAFVLPRFSSPRAPRRPGAAPRAAARRSPRPSCRRRMRPPPRKPRHPRARSRHAVGEPGTRLVFTSATGMRESAARARPSRAYRHGDHHARRVRAAAPGRFGRARREIARARHPGRARSPGALRASPARSPPAPALLDAGSCAEKSRFAPALSAPRRARARA